MARILTLLMLAALAACTTGPQVDADAGAPPDTALDAPGEDTPTATHIAAPPQIHEAPEPLFVAITPHAQVHVAAISQPQPTALVKAALEQAVQGLLFTSESDNPFQVFVLPGAAQPRVTARNVKKKLAAIYAQRPETMPLAQRTVETRTLAWLFRNYVHHQDWWGDFENERAPKFKLLKQILEGQLRHLHVYRIGPKTPWGLSPDIDVYIVGTTADDDVIGLWTVSIET